MATTNKVLFMFGSQRDYDSLSTKDYNALYFIEDTGRLYKGDKLFCECNVEFLNSKPTVSNALPNRLYVVTNDSGKTEIFVKKGNEIVSVGSGADIEEGAIKTLDVFDEDLIIKQANADAISEEDDSKLVTAAAVKEFVTNTLSEQLSSVSNDIGQVESNLQAVEQDLQGLISNNNNAIQVVSDELSEFKGSVSFTLSELSEAIVDVQVPSAGDKSTGGTTLTFIRQNGDMIDVPIVDISLTGASYDSTSKMLTLQVGQDGNTVETFDVDLKDLFNVDTYLINVEYNEQNKDLEFTVKDRKEKITCSLANIVASSNTNNVTMSNKITPTVNVGNYKAGQEIEITNLQKFLEEMLCEDFNPTKVPPTGTVTLNGSGSKEVGTQFTPSYTTTFNGGKYVYSNTEKEVASGVNATAYSVSDTASHTATTSSGSFAQFTVDDNTNYKVTATISYGDGTEPKTFLNNPIEDTTDRNAIWIKKGNITATSNAVTGYRNCYYGYKTSENSISNPNQISSAEIKELGMSSKATSATLPKTISTVNMKQMFFAIPSSLNKSLSIMGVSPPAPVNVYVVTENENEKVKIGGINNYHPIPYDVYYVNEDAEATGNMTYNLTWTNK